MEELKQIALNEIYPHPQNPRRDLGDVSELTESIKKNGIMQNLTVITGHWDDHDNFVEDGYTLLIGHRRYKAAKAAGIKEVPCRIITNMDEKEQVSTMLEENMQRADLTVWEQAQGFQMMLNLGDSEDDIAEKTGFSKQTIKHRLEIAKLDSKEIQKKEKDDSFQLTLKDLYELEKIEDVNTRNKILKEARESRDIVWRAHTAVREEKYNKRAAIIQKMLEDAGVKQAPEKVIHEQYSGKWDTVKEWSLDSDKEAKLAKSTLADIREGWLWYRCYGAIKLIKPSPKEQKKAEISQSEKDKKALSSLVKQLMKKKDIFIQEILEGKIEGIKETTEVISEVFNTLLILNVWVANYSLREFVLNKQNWDMSEEEKEEADKKIEEMSIIEKMLIPLSKKMTELSSNVVNWRGEYGKENANAILRGFEILSKWGWSFTEEEESVINGTNELYKKKED